MVTKQALQKFLHGILDYNNAANNAKKFDRMNISSKMSI